MRSDFSQRALARSNQLRTSETHRQDDVFGVRTTVSTVWSAPGISESELQAKEKYCVMRGLSDKLTKKNTEGFLALGGLHENMLCHTFQVMSPTNVQTVQQTSLLHIESSLVGFGLLSPTHGERSQQQSGQSRSD